MSLRDSTRVALQFTAYRASAGKQRLGESTARLDTHARVLKISYKFPVMYWQSIGVRALGSRMSNLGGQMY